MFSLDIAEFVVGEPGTVSFSLPSRANSNRTSIPAIVMWMKAVSRQYKALACPKFKYGRKLYVVGVLAARG